MKEQIFLGNKYKQWVKRLQAFALCVVNVTDEHTKARLKKSVGVKYKDNYTFT